ncbi:MAG: DinB family protein [Bacteroidota bacterium]
MNELAHYRDLLAYDRWASRRALDSIRAFGEEGDPDAVRLLAHIIGAQRVWITRLIGGDYMSLDRWPGLDIDACAVGLEMMYERWSRYLEDMDAEKFGAMIAYRNANGIAFENSVRDILMQVANHGTYHRAQIASVVRGKEKTPAVTDYIAYVWEVRG